MKRLLISITASMVIGTGAFGAGQFWADSALRLCNNTHDKTLQSAYAVQTPGGWQSHGWFELKPQACKRFELGAYKGKAYLYAEYNQGEMYWGSGPTNICVNKTSNFTVDNAFDTTKCEESISQKMVPSFEFSIIAGTNTFTFNP